MTYFLDGAFMTTQINTYYPPNVHGEEERERAREMERN